MSASYRYPGVKPFTQEDSHLFFGRNQDIQQLVRYLRTEDLVVLHGKSGLGKTSLIQAGVIPQLEASEKKKLPFEPITFRFNSFHPKNPQNVTHIAEANIDREPSFLDSLPVKYVSLWHALKSKQLSQGAPAKKQSYLLIFDQFEELFTYPEEEVEAFGHDLADLVNRVVPAEFRKVLRREEVVNPELKEKLAEEGVREWLNSEIDVKILIAIRSDKFNLLDRLSNYIPSILLNSRILEALNREQAAEAILEPAIMKGEFESPVFQYSDTAKDKILDFLTSDDTRRVEGFQLQILCRHIEENLIKFSSSKNKKSAGKIQITRPKDSANPYVVEDVDADFANILRNYYDDQVTKLNAEDQMLARKFIEDELIAEGRRVSLDRAVIKADVSDDLLYSLVNSRLIRREPNSLGGFSFEISHDTLLDPIMQARNERQIVEREQADRVEAREAAKKRQEELERERDAKDKELAQAMAEKAEIEKERAKEQAKAERKNKYFILTLLVMVAIITAITTFGLIKANETNKELEVNAIELKEARDALNRRAQGLSLDLESAEQESDSVRNIIASLPEEQRDFANSLGRMQSIVKRLNDTLGNYEGIPRGEAMIKNGRLIVRVHLFDNSQYNLNPKKEKDIPRITFFKRIAEIIRAEEGFGLQVEVHTDKSGLVGSNLKSSMARAYSLSEPLFEVFSEDGDASRVSIVARGESDPIDGASKAENRRVDMVMFPRSQPE